MSYLGLDIGTGGCKAVVFSAEGKELASAYREYPLIHPQPGWAELDPERVISACFEVIKEVNARVRDPVAAMSVSSQGEAFTAVDAQGRALCNAMVSSDSRAGELTKSWSAEFGAEKIYRITGHTPHPIFTLYKLIWLKNNRPEIWKSARWFLCFEELFQFRAGIPPKISWPLAGRTMLFDVMNHCWSAEILSLLELDYSRLADPVPSGSVAGVMPVEKARELGFRDEVMVVAGGHDQTCGALGAGVTSPGMCMYATGTVECFCPLLEKPSFSEELRRNNLCCYDYTIGEQYTTVAYSLTGGNILRWMRDTLGQTEVEQAKQRGVDPYTVLLEAIPDEPTSLLTLPYLSASGTPYFDTGLPGAILGLRLSTTKGEITRSLLEGVAFEMKLNLILMEQSGMKIDTLIATGGGTKNERWTQLKADVLGKKIVVREVNEAGCFGAAMLACSMHSGIPVTQCVERAISDKKVFIPDQANTAAYDRIFEKYKQLYPTLKPLYG